VQLSSKYTVEQITFILEQRDEKQATFPDIAKRFNIRFEPDKPKTANALEKIHRKWTNIGFKETDLIEALETKRKVQIKSRKNNKQTNSVLDSRISYKEALEGIEKLFDRLSIEKVTVPPAPKNDSLKRQMVMELMVSDVHFGKKTKTFNLAVCNNRLKKLGQVFVSEMERSRLNFHIESVVISLLGDIIESETMHKQESARSCEFGNARQVFEAIDGIYENIIKPIAMTGVNVKVPCVTGNHDRTEPEKTYLDEGEHNVTWTIYNGLRKLCEVAGFTNVEFEITTKSYLVFKIFEDYVLLEHGHHIKGTNRQSFENQIMKRSRQVKRMIKFLRLGHWHESMIFGRGRIVVNASVCGQDSYAETLGYDSSPSQTINFYVQTNNRPDTFYHSFPVCLE
jgi:hypothetical protein